MTERKDDYKSCSVCGGWHHPKAIHLDYVGHAALTDRLLDADPKWNWEPVAFGPDGNPLMVNGGLWIRLTVDGVTRLGYGDAQQKQGHNAIKEAIGDALRNAAMRFGAALDLWHKGDLHEAKEAQGDKPGKKKARTKTAVAKDIKAFHLAMTNTGTLDALDAFTSSHEAKSLIKELAADWPEELENLKAEKAKHVERLKGDGEKVLGDPEALLDDLVRKMKSEKSEKNCQEMFKLGKFDLLSADADPVVIAEYEREYNEHVNGLMMGN